MQSDRSTTRRPGNALPSGTGRRRNNVWQTAKQHSPEHEPCSTDTTGRSTDVATPPRSTPHNATSPTFRRSSPTGSGSIGEANQRLEQIDEKLNQAQALISRRPSLETQVAEIDDRLDADLRRRTRIARLEQPTAIVAVLGERPAPGAAAHEWDHAAGRLHQHQAAFDLTAGIGRLPGSFDNTAYAASHRLVEQEVKSVVYVPELPSRGIESPGISL